MTGKIAFDLIIIIIIIIATIHVMSTSCVRNRVFRGINVRRLFNNKICRDNDVIVRALLTWTVT